MGLRLTVVGDNGETELVRREAHVFGEAGDVGIAETNYLLILNLSENILGTRELTLRDPSMIANSSTTAWEVGKCQSCEPLFFLLPLSSPFRSHRRRGGIRLRDRGIFPSPFCVHANRG